jgi:hypothetical protein
MLCSTYISVLPEPEMETLADLVLKSLALKLPEPLMLKSVVCELPLKLIDPEPLITPLKLIPR